MVPASSRTDRANFVETLDTMERPGRRWAIAR
jgi:hypothetical protein